MLEFLKDIGYLAGAILGIYVIWQKALVPVYKLLKRMEEVHDIIVDLPDWKDQVDLKLDQLSPNSGSSLYDHVASTGETLAVVQGDVSSLKTMVQEHLNDPNAHHAAVAEIGEN